MRKNFTFLFLLGIFGLFTTNLFAQQDATIDPADIRYWICEGENEVVFIVNWAEPDTALAWGYRFAGESVTIKDVMDGIAAVDYRFSYDSPNGSWLNDIFFNDGFLDLSLTEPMWVSYLVNGESSWNTFDVQTLVNGDYVKWGDTYCGTLIDPENYIYVWEKEVAAVYPLADEAMIDPADIRYWVGEGENEVVFCVNWAEPDTALAWGYRFNEETVTVKTVMDALAAADARFNYVVGAWGVDDITFNDGYLNLGITEYSYFMYNVNGNYAWFGFDEQTVSNGDFIKFGDAACGTEIAPWTYVWEKEVVPVYTYAVEAMIDPSEILYWVGEGNNQVVFCVNWNNPNKALAWGYRFNEESVTVKAVMDAIKDVDERFDYVIGAWGVDDITFHDGELNLGLTEYSYFMYNVNGNYAWFGFDEQTVSNGDFIKFGDITCGTEIAAWTYVWTQEVEPVSVYIGVNENLAQSLSVYPNPAVYETYVTLENAGLNEVSVYDMQGRLVSSESFVANAGEQVRLSTVMLTAGMYIVRVNSDNNVKTAKLIVK